MEVTNAQPFLVVHLLDDGSEIIINENHVVSVKKLTDDNAHLTMSSGEEYSITDPSYPNWINDCLKRH